MYNNDPRPNIKMENGVLTRNGIPARVVITKHLVCVDCTDVSPEALKFLAEAYNARFETLNPVFEVQTGRERVNP